MLKKYRPQLLLSIQCGGSNFCLGLLLLLWQQSKGGHHEVSMDHDHPLHKKVASKKTNFHYNI